jgi:hypothetical protein
MTIDTIISINPKRIRTQEEVDSILSKIKDYERAKNCKGGVVLKQNRQFGASYRVVSEEEAVNGINHPRTCEWYVKFYPRCYFEGLRKKFNGIQNRY